MTVLALLTLAGCQAMPTGGGSNNGEPTADRPATIVITSPTGGTIDPSVGVSAVAGQDVTFSAMSSTDEDGALTYSWDFDASDGITVDSTDGEVTHRYAEAGEYTVTLTVTDARGFSMNQSFIVVVAQALPVASFFWSPVTGVAPLSVDFDATATTDTDSDPSTLIFDWNFDDGMTGTGSTVSHIFAMGGTYEVVLTVTDPDGNATTNMNPVMVAVGNLPPTASFTATPMNGDAPLTVNFDANGATDEDEATLTYNWNFGGTEGTATGVTTSHVYDEPGMYTVTLTVTDLEGLTAAATLLIDVDVPNTAPMAVIEADLTSGLAPLTVIFDGTKSTDSEDGTATFFSWDFDAGDGIEIEATGTGGVGQPVTHKYTASGTYVVTLTVGDFDGGEDTTTTTIEVNAIVSLAVDTNAMSLETGGTDQLTVIATLDDDEATEIDVTEDDETIYASDDVTVVTVAADGLVTAGNVTVTQTATITITRSDFLDPAVEATVDVTVYPVLSTMANVTGLPTEGYVQTLVPVTLTATPEGGLDGDDSGDVTYTFNWDLISKPGDSLLTDATAFADDTLATTVFTPDKEGEYLITVTITDEGGNAVTSAPISVIVSNFPVPAPFLNVNGGVLPIADTCVVGAVSGATANGADGPAALTDPDAMLHPGVTDPTGLTFEWTMDPVLGTLTGADTETPTWVPGFVDVVTPVTFSVSVTHPIGTPGETVTLPPQSTSIDLTPASELSDICGGTDTQPCPAGPLTHTLENGDTMDVTFYLNDYVDDSDMDAQLSALTGPTGPATVDSCVSGTFLDEQTCMVTFDDAGLYTFLMRLKNSACVDGGQSSENPKQRVDTIFSVNVTGDAPFLAPLTATLPVDYAPQGYVPPCPPPGGCIPDTTIILAANASGGVQPYTYVWELDTTGAPSSTLTSADLSGASPTIVLDVEGAYAVTVTVTDSTNAMLVSNVDLVASNFIAPVPYMNVNDGVPPVPDTCMVAAVSGETANGADGPAILTDSDGVLHSGVPEPTDPDLEFVWTMDPVVGTITPGFEGTATFVPDFLNVDTTVTFSVTITHPIGAGPETVTLPPQSFSIPLTPAAEFSDICGESCIVGPGPLTHSLADGHTMTVTFDLSDQADFTNITQSFKVFNGTNATVDPDCAGGLYDNDDTMLDGVQECSITFNEDFPLTYQFLMRLRNNTCTDEQDQGLGKQRVDTTFTVDVTN